MFDGFAGLIASGVSFCAVESAVTSTGLVTVMPDPVAPAAEPAVTSASSVAPMTARPRLQRPMYAPFWTVCVQRHHSLPAQATEAPDWGAEAECARGAAATETANGRIQARCISIHRIQHMLRSEAVTFSCATHLGFRSMAANARPGEISALLPRTLRADCGATAPLAAAMRWWRVKQPSGGPCS